MIKVAICDDEKEFADKLEKKITEYAEKQQIDISIEKYYDAESLLRNQLELYQILFLDVKLGKDNGIEIGRMIRKRSINSIIIYISSYIEMAPMGYEVKAFRYIVKNDLEQVFPYTLRDALEELKKRNKTYEIKNQGKTEKILLSHILYFESFKRYVTIYTQKGDYQQYRKLSDLEEELKEAGFSRIHKSYLVNMAHITCIQNGEVHLDNGKILKCSKTNYQEIIKRYILWEGIEC